MRHGDRIRILQDNYFEANVKLGDLLTVERIYAHYFEASTVGGLGYSFPLNGKDLGFEIVDRSPSPSSAISQLVAATIRWEAPLCEGRYVDEDRFNALYRAFEKRGEQLNDVIQSLASHRCDYPRNGKEDAAYMIKQAEAEVLAAWEGEL